MRASLPVAQAWGSGRGEACRAASSVVTCPDDPVHGLVDHRVVRHRARHARAGDRHVRRRALGQPVRPDRRGGLPGGTAARVGHVADRGPGAEGPLDGRPLGSPRGRPGQRIELVDGSIYMAISIRNVGPGLAVPFGWHLTGGAPTIDMTHAEPEDFRAQTRDLYVAPSDVGFWQAAIRSADDPDYHWLSRKAVNMEPFTIELLYGDHDGRQRTITRFGMIPWTRGEVMPCGFRQCRGTGTWTGRIPADDWSDQAEDEGLPGLVSGSGASEGRQGEARKSGAHQVEAGLLVFDEADARRARARPNRGRSTRSPAPSRSADRPREHACVHGARDGGDEARRRRGRRSRARLALGSKPGTVRRNMSGTPCGWASARAR